MFLLFIKFKFPWKNGIPVKIKSHLPQQLPPPLPPALQQLFSPHNFNLIQKIVSSTYLKKRAETMHYI